MLQIYALKDPDSLEIKYIGKTNRPNFRLATHYKDVGNKEKYNWLHTLKSNGKKPVFETLEWCTEKNWEEKEIAQIKRAIESGAKLFNKTSGGLNKKKRLVYRIAVSLDTETLNKAKIKSKLSGHYSVGAYIRGLVIKDVL